VTIRHELLQPRIFCDQNNSSLELAEGGVGDALASSLSTLAEHLSGLVATETSAPLTALFVVLVGEVGLGGADDGGEFALVLALDFLEGDDSRGLLVDHSAKTGLALDDNVGYSHLTTESGEEDDELNGVNIVGNDNKSSFLGFDERDDMVKTVFDKQRLLGILGVLVFVLGSGSGSSSQTSLLLLLGFGAVLVEELEQLSGGVLVQSVRKLGDRRRDLEALVKDDLLALKADILGPLDETGEIGLGADVLANTEVLGGSLEERVLFGLGRLASSKGSSSRLLAGSGFGFGGLVIETKSARAILREGYDAPRSSSAVGASRRIHHTAQH